jgi:hypothetical protein
LEQVASCEFGIQKKYPSIWATQVRGTSKVPVPLSKRLDCVTPKIIPNLIPLQYLYEGVGTFQIGGEYSGHP